MSPSDEVAQHGAGESRHIYPASAMVGDYLRAAAGLVPTGVVFATMPVGAVPAMILGGFAAIFAIFGLRTVLRHGTSLDSRIEGFDRVVRRAAEAAVARGLVLGEATVFNLQSLGLDLPGIEVEQ